MSLQGLQPRIPRAFMVMQPEATPEERLGDSADPRHGQALWEGPQPKRYPWQKLRNVGQSGPDGGVTEVAGHTEGYALQAGTLAEDPQAETVPWTHRGPWPKGVIQGTDPDSVAEHLAWSARLHAIASGAARKIYTTISAQQDQWTDFWTVDAGTSMQDGVNGQVKQAASGWGSTDRAANQARQNSFGFDSAHLHRRWATGSVPGNYLWMRPSGRPLRKTVAGPARPPVGDISPFTGQDLQRDFGVQGAVLQDSAVEYTPPAEPYIAPSYPAGGDPADVAWW